MLGGGAGNNAHRSGRFSVVRKDSHGFIYPLAAHLSLGVVEDNYETRFGSRFKPPLDGAPGRCLVGKADGGKIMPQGRAQQRSCGVGQCYPRDNLYRRCKLSILEIAEKCAGNGIDAGVAGGYQGNIFALQGFGYCYPGALYGANISSDQLLAGGKSGYQVQAVLTADDNLYLAEGGYCPGVMFSGLPGPMPTR